MNKKATVLLASLITLTSSPALATYSDGQTAFNSGNYLHAYQELSTPANQGDPRAQYLLGRMYMDGNGVTQDYVQAHMWLNLATTGSVSEARGYRDAVGSRMTGQQIATAQEMARTWRSTSPTGSVVSAVPQATIGYSVLNTQRLLNQLGHDAGPADGAMGRSTQAGIRSYQYSKGLEATGRLSQDLFDRIAVDAGYAGNAGAGIPPATIINTVDAKPYSQLVSEVQTKLRAMDYGVGSATGQMNSETEAAIRDYQDDVGLRATGVADADLLRHLTADGLKADRRETRMTRVAQRRLQRLGYDIGSADGVVDWRTSNAVRRFQTDQGLAVNGEIDKELLKSLKEKVHAEAKSARSHQDDDQEIALKIESALTKQGYHVGIEDGLIDEGAKAAIRQYQQDWGLEVDGQASAGLLGHIENPPSTGRVASPALIKNIERELFARGYPVGVVDGRVDDAFRTAVRAWQSDAQIAPNDRLDEALLANIQASAATRVGTTPTNSFIQGIADAIINGVAKAKE